MPKMRYMNSNPSDWHFDGILIFFQLQGWDVLSLYPPQTITNLTTIYQHLYYTLLQRKCKFSKSCTSFREECMSVTQDVAGNLHNKSVAEAEMTRKCVFLSEKSVDGRDIF